MRTAIALCTACLVVSTAPAQMLHVLHHFTGGENPWAPLALGPDGNIYGTGRSSGYGSIFRLTPQGVVTTLASFTGPNGHSPSIVGLVAGRDGGLYGTTEYGGTGGRGTMFRVTTAGVLTTLVHFNNTNGSSPRGLALGASGDLYGTTVTSAAGGGTVYKVATSGAFTALTTFPANYGSYPAGLVAGPDGHFYGRTYEGVSGVGTVFRVTTNGALMTLATLNGVLFFYSTGLTLGRDGHFYGTTFGGGNSGRGTAFRVGIDGALTTLVHFNITNGALPAGPLTLGPEGNLYGTTIYGGAFEGTVFRMRPDGALTTLAHFTSRPITGVRPYGGVIFGPNGSLYGTTATGGGADSGVIFRIDLPPILVSDPASRTNTTGTTATFTVEAAGTGPLNYRWWRNGTPLADGGNISGAGTDTLTLANVQPGDAGGFAAVVSNPLGSVTSAEAVLAVVSLDADGDGVRDDRDQCPGTRPGAVVDEHGCAIVQLVPCDGPWRNHGEYVTEFAHAVREFVQLGLLTREEGQALLVAAAQSDCGKKSTLPPPRRVQGH